MSFCRWSSDNWHCDLYCYEDSSGGITTHVAHNRVIGEIPEAPMSLIMDGKYKKFLKLHKKQMAFLEEAKHEKIGLPHDGLSFNDLDYVSFLVRLQQLREAGYNFPNYVFEIVREQIQPTPSSKQGEE